MPSVARDQVQCAAPAPEVLAFLESGAGLPYRVSKVVGSSDTIQFSTGWSAFSWGEKVEVTVIGRQPGCVILCRGARAWSLNVTSNPRTPVEKILAALSAKFGPLI